MSDSFLKNLIKIIENPDYVVMYNDGKDKFCILKHKVHYLDDEAAVYFKDFTGQYVDIFNTTIHDFKFFCELEISNMLEGMEK